MPIVQCGRIVPTGTDAGVRDVPHPSSGVAEMLKEALHLVLFHARSDGSHHLIRGRSDHHTHRPRPLTDLAVSHTADLVCESQDGLLCDTLEHTTVDTHHNVNYTCIDIILTIQQWLDAEWNC